MDIPPASMHQFDVADPLQLSPYPSPWKVWELPLFIYTPYPHLCTIPRDYTQSQWLPHWRPDDFPDVDSPEVDNSHSPSSLGPEWHQTSRRRIGTGPRDAMAPSAITWTPIYGRLGTRRLGTITLCILFVDWPSQGSILRAFSLDFPWLDLSGVFSLSQ
jgi:hypothetical protein